MSAYRLQRYLFDQMGAWSTDRSTSLDRSAYELTAEESAAVESNDVGALYALGVHPVLLNAWCRATGYSRDQYRVLLEPFRRPTEEVARWRSSA